ncbi:YfbU family protein [Paraburkholderia sp. RL18-103-BIB-C]|uniref:YfbU family protein n=1 Tax=Paraburkholderia sp. RL18-103-BIB-C TaxID=3031637 RepID=UPI0038BE1DFC
MRFSDGEKMLMLMMRDMFKALKIKDPDTDADFLAEVIYGGHYWAPKWKMTGVFHDHVDNPRDLKHVVDVLDMWSFIEEAYEGFSAAEKAAIAEQVGPLGKHVRFTGFDGNNESSQMSIAMFLVEEMGRFSRFKGRDLNSHHPTYDHYSRMFELFEPMRTGLIGNGLSVGQVVTLLKA